MSVYPHPPSSAYGQPYSVPGYGQPLPPHPSYPYQPPPPQPVYHVDPNMFRRDYMARLAELTVNSRPIIQNLSMLAQDYARFAEVVVQCIETHIRRVPPWMKLPAFYLLDAISKNVFDPYARHFTPVVVRLYLDTYEQVDQTTRSKMEEMLLTWRTGAPNGRELFGVVPQVAIERQIWPADPNQHAQIVGRQPSNQTSISTSQVISELEFILNQKERALQANPYDRTALNHVNVLQQLRKLVQAGVSQNELTQILNQLRSLAAPAPSVPAPSAMQMPYPPQPTYTVPRPSIPLSQPPFQQQTPYPDVSYEQPKPEPVDLGSLLSGPSAPAPAPSTSAAPPANIANLFNALLKAGVVSASGTPTGAESSVKAEGPSQPSDPRRDSAREYRKALLKHKVKLTTADITKQRPPIVQLLYGRLSLQCKQCAIRYPDGPEGKKKLEDHLDMHFRQNRKSNQSGGRGHSRSWFVSVEDWIHDGAVDAKGKGRAEGSHVNSKAAAAAEAAKRDAELRAQFVVVPAGDEAKPISCPICKEHLKSEFLEDDEEWVWRNAVKKDDRIFHATCHAEAIASKTSLATRLRNEISSRSRSRTPEQPTTPPKANVAQNGDVRQSSSPTPSKLSGTKRKAEDSIEASPSSHEQSMPPAKKLETSS